MAEYKVKNYDNFFYRMFEFNVKMKRVSEPIKLMDCIALGL